MKYRALVSFSGVISMAEGEVREIEDPTIVNDLLKAGYIHPVPPGGPSALGADGKSKLFNNEPPAISASEASGSKKAVKKEEVKKTKKRDKKKDEN